MPSILVVGAQWGDEGKGKIIDILSSQADCIVRAQGGNNAGHTVLIGSEEYKLHLIPSGILHPHTQCIIGAGTVIDPEVLLHEIQVLQSRNIDIKRRLWISPLAHVILPYHRQIDALAEKRKGNLSIGTTGRGIGPCYADKTNRIGIRVGEFIRPDLFPDLLKNVLSLKNEELVKLYDAVPIDFDELLKQCISHAECLKPFVADVENNVHDVLEACKNVLFEGAQGTFLDLTFGTYPYVTSSSTIAAGICTGAGVGPSSITHTLGVMKAYTTRVGNGPFPTEDLGKQLAIDAHKARELGTTTGRHRRVGWFDAIMAKASVKFNGLQSLALTKLDILDHLESLKICTGYQINGNVIRTFPSMTQDLAQVTPLYETLPGWKTPTGFIKHFNDLPPNAKAYVNRIEELCGIPVSMLSVGPERDKAFIIHPLFDSEAL